MSHEIVHSMGSTAYFVFILLFLWSRGIPRTNPGSGWWAIAITFALLGRLAMLTLLPAEDPRLAIGIYVFFNVLEKPCLLIGLTRFLNIDIAPIRFWIPAIVAELWLGFALATELQPFARSMGYSLINAGFMLTMALLISRYHDGFPGWPMLMAGFSSAVLFIHWLAAPLLIFLFPSWFKNAFLLGTALVLVQYLSLLAATLSLFQTRLIDAEAKALDLAYLDPLTGLNNQRYMTSLFDHALLLATRPHQIVAIFYIDLDNFKPINDTAGHAVGDEVLKTVAARLKTTTRSTDICARVGGDEFVVIGTQLENEEQAIEIAKKLIAQLTKAIPIGERNFSLGASVGIGLYPKHGTDLNFLVQCADKAMYHIKHRGKNGWVIYDAHSHQASSND